MEHEVNLVVGQWRDMHFSIPCLNDNLADGDAVWIQDHHADSPLRERVFLGLSDLDELRLVAAYHFHSRITPIGVVGSNPLFANSSAALWPRRVGRVCCPMDEPTDVRTYFGPVLRPPRSSLSA